MDKHSGEAGEGRSQGKYHTISLIIHIKLNIILNVCISVVFSCFVFLFTGLRKEKKKKRKTVIAFTATVLFAFFLLNHK